MSTTKEKFPENINSLVKESLGFELEDLLGDKKIQVLKNDLKAMVCINPIDHHPVKTPVTLDKGTHIIIENFGFHSMGLSNTVEFQLRGFYFDFVDTRVTCKSHFFVHIDKIVAALK